MHKVDLAPRPLVGAAPQGSGAEKKDEAKKAQQGWWLSFQSAELNALTLDALEKNFDVVAAGERLNQALAVYRRAGGVLKPQLNLTGAFDSDLAAKGRELRDDGWEAGAEITWEVDFFKRLGSARLARAADVRARESLREVVRLSLSVSIAESYFGIIEQRQLLALLAKQQQTSRDLLRIIERRYEQGLVSRLDVLQQQAQVAEVDSQIPTVEALLMDLQNQLGALLSGMPGARELGTIGAQAVFPTLPELEMLGRPDDLLRMRPDLRAAQADLVSADAETARALAERLPRLTLSAEGVLIEGRGASGSLVTFAADLVQPLLDWGQRRQEWVRTKAVYRERLAIFSQAYVRAVWNLDTLVRTEAKQRELMKRLQERKQLLDATLGLATNRYTSGLTDYLPVLSATQQLYALEQRLIREQRRLTSLRIALHQALGGPVPVLAEKSG
ncbi:TolC family protein [Nibricoccus aquaticus]|uniref:TolC family protein n=1 Tax=Nibricoccus aquaticus TaxID=2576891 RepID=UPI0015863F8D|nr:TolC family protein [Nibricoccus aquaticus]